MNIKINSVRKCIASKISEEKREIIKKNIPKEQKMFNRKLKGGGPWGWAAEIPRNAILDLKNAATIEENENTDTILYKNINWKITDNTPEDWTKEDLQKALHLWIDEYFRN